MRFLSPPLPDLSGPQGRSRVTARADIADPGFAQGQLNSSPRLDAHLSSCLQCRACEAACPSLVSFGSLMDGARALRVRDTRAFETRAEKGATQGPEQRLGHGHGRRALPALPLHRNGAPDRKTGSSGRIEAAGASPSGNAAGTDRTADGVTRGAPGRRRGPGVVPRLRCPSGTTRAGEGGPPRPRAARIPGCPPPRPVLLRRHAPPQRLPGRGGSTARAKRRRFRRSDHPRHGQRLCGGAAHPRESARSPGDLPLPRRHPVATRRSCGPCPPGSQCTSPALTAMSCATQMPPPTCCGRFLKSSPCPWTATPSAAARRAPICWTTRSMSATLLAPKIEDAAAARCLYPGHHQHRLRLAPGRRRARSRSGPGGPAPGGADRPAARGLTATLRRPG